MLIFILYCTNLPIKVYLFDYNFSINDNMADKTEQQKKRTDLHSLPTKQYLDQTVAPILLQGLQILSRERPPDPLSFLANYLIKNKGRDDISTDQT